MSSKLILPDFFADLRQSLTLRDDTRQALIEQQHARTAEVLANQVDWLDPAVLASADGRKSYFARTPVEKRLPDWRFVERALITLMAGYRLAEDDGGNLVFGELNAKFGNLKKANWFSGAYKQIFWRQHVMALEEVDPEFVAAVCKMTGYTGYCTKPGT